MNKIIKRSFAVIISMAVLFAATISVCGAESYAKNKNVNFSAHFDLTDAGKYESNPQERMAHNIYSDPDLSNTCGKFDGFMIDFKADYAPNFTYWALCNWAMDTSELEKKNTIIDNGGAYSGLQVWGDGSTAAIMSFWNIEYKTPKGESKIITPTLVYPVKNGNTYFDNEGSGASYLTPYKWEKGKWYTMYICSYDDEKTGYTFVDMWVKKTSSKKWTKICTYNTKLKKSCFWGGMSQFMEDYGFETSTEARSFEYRNLYIREYKSDKWTNISKSKLSVDTWWDNKKGSFSFGSTSTCLWGITLGYGKDQAKMNEDIYSIENIKPTAKVPKLPKM